MRHRSAVWRALAATVISVSLLVPPFAGAQDIGGPDDYDDEYAGDDYGADEDAGEVGGTSVQVPAEAATPGEMPGPTPQWSEAPQTYTVVRGDTLWDITQRVLGNPWYWPKVWSFNPEIANPNWIYPGNVIRFAGGAAVADQGPARLLTPEEASVQGLDFQYEAGTEEVVTPAGQLSYVPPESSTLAVEGFVTREQIEASGRIVASFEEKSLLSTLDKVYLEFPGGSAQIGDRFLIYRPSREVKHPKTGEFYGYLTQIIGRLQVTSLSPEGVPTAIIGDVLDAAVRGDYLVPAEASLSEVVVERQNQVELEAVILTTMVPQLLTIGEHYLVFLDKGRQDGVEVGNTFTIMRQGDPLAFEREEMEADLRLPWETIGRVMVIDTRDAASLAIVINSIREFEVGARAVMRVGSSGATAMR